MSINNNALINSRNIRFSDTKTCLEIDKDNTLKEEKYLFTQKIKSASNKIWQYFGYNSITENNLEISLKHTYYQLEQTSKKSLPLTDQQLSETEQEIKNILNNEHFKQFLDSPRGTNAKTYLENIQLKLEKTPLQNIYNHINAPITDQKLLEIKLEIQNIEPKGEIAKIFLENIQLKLDKIPNNKAMQEFITKKPVIIACDLLNTITKLELNLNEYPFLKEKFEKINQINNEIIKANSKMFHKSTELMENHISNHSLISKNLKTQENKILKKIHERKVSTFIKQRKDSNNSIFNSIKSIEKRKSWDNSIEKTLKKGLGNTSPRSNSNDHSFNSLTQQIEN